MEVCEARQVKAHEILSLVNPITQTSLNTYKVKSQSNNGEYVVTNGEKWDCSCPDHFHRSITCKHILAVQLSIELKLQVSKNHVIQPITVSGCLYCESSNIRKDGLRRNKYGNIQKFKCKECGRYFTINIGFERMKHNPQAITTALQLYFSGESLRNTMKSLRLLGVEVSHQTVYNWIRKYASLMNRYVEKLQPNVSDTWRADELWLKIKGDKKYLFALMDDETRFLIAQEVADSKHKHNPRNLFKKGKELIGRKPNTLITDGLHSYHDAYKKEYWTTKKPRTEHINTIKLSGDMNNNKMERLMGEVRDREKVMRGMKRSDTPILKGYQIYHNYIREHEGLKGKTPSEACGIEVKGKNKWITLIQNASKKH